MEKFSTQKMSVVEGSQLLALIEKLIRNSWRESVNERWRRERGINSKQQQLALPLPVSERRMGKRREEKTKHI